MVSYTSLRKLKKNENYLALLYDDNTRVFVSFLTLFLLAIDTFKLSLKETTKRNIRKK